ncbi:hypothetical protein DFP98_15020 [Cohnella phaseoli]|uniref:Lycopene cyclase domain-containing protein n=1 Tax=Cohnella phaseoli TaxID=456490 RepID=A0A3D9HUL7_9BACL|nr:hypothetical protein DFP98_15020 [Cohnella phaseoli]
MEILLGIFSILVSVFLLALLIFGLIQCKKNHFIEGFYFFLIVIFLKIYYVIAPFTINRFIDSYFVNPTLLPLKMTIGEMITLLNFIPRTLEVIAFFFLVVGLYRMWKTKD